MYLYQNEAHHIGLRNKVFEYINNNKEQFYIYFKGNNLDNNNIINSKNLLDQYIAKHNKESAYAGNIEYMYFY